MRRASVIILYLIVLYLLVGIAIALSMSPACVESSFRRACSAVDYLWALVLIPAWVGLSVLCIIYGWRGKLYGCRVRRQPPQVTPGTPS